MTSFVLTVLVIAASVLVLVIASIAIFLGYCDKIADREIEEERKRVRAKALFQDQTFD
jgi:hypothetical protein